jgi:RNA polymerase sigma-70 factor (ECF subfamily)
VNDDASLVSRCLRRDPEAMRQLVERYQAEIFRLTWRIIGHHHDAEDVCQEVFLRVFRSLRTWDSSRPFKPWLMRIAVNAARTRLRTNARRPKNVDQLDEFATASPKDDSAELRQEIDRALSDLRFEYRTVFALFHGEGLSYEEMANILNCPIGTVKTWLHRARLEIHRQLVERGMLDEPTPESAFKNEL